jgi:predicted Zn-dependent protease
VLARVYIAAGGGDEARSILAEFTHQHPGDGFIAELQSQIFPQPNGDQDGGGDSTRFALAQAKAGNIAAAEAALKDWLAAHPDDVEPRQALGDIELAAKRFDAAQALYEAVLARDPNNAAAENNLAWILSRQGNAGAALDHAEHAARLAPDAPRVLDTLGVVFLLNQRAADAVGPLTKAAQDAPNDPGIQFHFAEALAGVGEKLRARDVLQTVLAAPQAFDERDDAQSLLRSLGG